MGVLWRWVSVAGGNGREGWRAEAVMVGLIALTSVCVFWLQALAWPLMPGRDAATYIQYFVDYGSARPVYHNLMLLRTPVAPFFYGPLLALGGGCLVELVHGVLFAASIVFVYLAGCRWVRLVGLVAALYIMLLPGYGALFHQISTDGLFCFAFSAFIWVIVTAISSPRVRWYIASGAMIGVLTLLRPVAQVFVVFAAYPLLFRGPAFRQRVRFAAAIAIPAGAILLGWATHNFLRFDDFAVSRTGWAVVPFHRLCVLNRCVHPDNGPATRELADAVREHLLPHEPYRSYGIDENTFFSRWDFRMWADMVHLTDRVWGWDTDYRRLRAASIEAIRRYPVAYARGVLSSLNEIFTRRLMLPPPTRAASLSAPEEPPFDDLGLPVPSEGQLIPASRLFWLASSPGGEVTYDWAAFLSGGELGFSDPVREKQRREHHERVRQLLADIPARDGSWRASMLLNHVTQKMPTARVWFFIASLGLPFLSSCQRRASFLLLALSLLAIGVTVLSIEGTVHYRVPYDSAFVLVGVAGLVAVCRKVGIRVPHIRRISKPVPIDHTDDA